MLIPRYGPLSGKFFNSCFLARKIGPDFSGSKLLMSIGNYQAKRLGQPSEVAEAVWEPGLQLEDGWMDR